MCFLIGTHTHPAPAVVPTTEERGITQAALLNTEATLIEYQSDIQQQELQNS